MAFTTTQGDYTLGMTSPSMYGYGETEEERRKREEEAARLRAIQEPTPVTQTIKTDPVTGEQEMTIKGRPEDLSANNPFTPTVSQPVSPDQFMGGQTSEPINVAAVPGPTSDTGAPPGWQRMLQAESGNRDYTASGAPVTSPKGAMFAAQVLPTTASNPGYGVIPAQAQTPEEYNRVGQDYYQAMLKKYNGDENLARAAYNAGPGRVDQAIQLASAQGGSPLQYLPRETQGYVQQTAAPAAPAAPVTPQQVAQPAAPEPSPMYGAPEAGGPGLRMPGQQPQAAPSISPIPGQGVTSPQALPTPPNAIDDFYQKQDNPTDMMAYARREDAPEYLKERAYARAAELMRMDVDKTAAQKQVNEMVARGDSLGIAKALQSKGEEGSWAKMLLLGFISPQLAGEEAKKLGFGAKWEQTTITLPDGTEKTVEVKKRGDGKLLEATDLGGEPLSREEFNLAAGGMGAGKVKPDVSTQDVEKNGMAGRVVTTYDKNNRPKTMVESGGKMYAYDTSWKPRSIATAAAKAEQGQQITLKYAEAIQAAKGSGETKGKLTEYGVNVLTTPDGNIVLEQNGTILKPDANGNVSITTPGGKPTSLAALRSGEKLSLERGQGVIKAMDEEIRPQAQAGDTVSSVRKQQFAIFDRPGIDANKLFGIATGAGQSPGDQKWTIVRDIFSGAVVSNADGSPMNGQQLSQRLYGLNLSPAELSALSEYNIANQKINAATLKQTAGPGSVSNAEQQANRESNVDITKIPALGAYNAMAQSQFDGDRARYKADWAAGKDFKSALEMDKAWRKENQQLADIYAERAKERIKFINDNGNSFNAVKEGYKLFPVPEYDPATETWKKKKPLGSYNR